MRRTSVHARSVIAAAVLLVVASTPVRAQDAASPDAAPKPQPQPAQAGDGSGSTQSVVVTANRRREPAREVPMQLDVISADAADKSGAKSLTDLLADLPGVDVKTQGGPGLGAISVRGISTGDQTVSTVGTYIDGRCLRLLQCVREWTIQRAPDEPSGSQSRRAASRPPGYAVRGGSDGRLAEVRDDRAGQLRARRKSRSDGESHQGRRHLQYRKRLSSTSR